jgi:hypothetical protein
VSVGLLGGARRFGVVGHLGESTNWSAVPCTTRYPPQPDPGPTPQPEPEWKCRAHRQCTRVPSII